MTILGIIFLFIGAMGIAGLAFNRYRGGRFANTPFVKTGEAASSGASVSNEKDAISVEGAVHCDQLLTSPVTHTPCLYYTLKVTAQWKVGDNERSVEITNRKEAAAFSLDDGSGPVGIDAAKGGDFTDLEKTFKKKKGLGIIADFKGEGVAFGEQGFTVQPGQKIKGKKIPETAKYEVTEECLEPTERLYACGKYEGGRIGSPSWASLVLDGGGREALMSKTLTFETRSKWVAIAGSVLGAIFLIIGAVTGDPSTPVDASTAGSSTGSSSEASSNEANSGSGKSSRGGGKTGRNLRDL